MRTHQGRRHAGEWRHAVSEVSWTRTQLRPSSVGPVWPTLGGEAPDPGSVFGRQRSGIEAMAPIDVPRRNQAGAEPGR